MLERLISRIRRKKRTDPETIRQWIPRLLKAAFNTSPKDRVTFLVARSFVDRCTVVETAPLMCMLFKAVQNGMTGISGSLLPQIICAGKPRVELPGTFSGMLYSMH